MYLFSLFHAKNTNRAYSQPFSIKKCLPIFDIYTIRKQSSNTKHTQNTYHTRCPTSNVNAEHEPKKKEAVAFPRLGDFQMEYAFQGPPSERPYHHPITLPPNQQKKSATITHATKGPITSLSLSLFKSSSHPILMSMNSPRRRKYLRGKRVFFCYNTYKTFHLFVWMSLNEVLFRIVQIIYKRWPILIFHTFILSFMLTINLIYLDMKAG